MTDSDAGQRMPEIKPRGSYGIDAPWVPCMWLGFSVGYVVLAVLAATLWHAWWWIAVLLAVVAVAFAVGAALYWYASLRGKFVLWNGLLASVAPITAAPGSGVSGTGAQCLDLGCGHGMVSIMTALRLGTAEVVGIDLWRSVDQSGNTVAAARRNAASNGVSDRVRFDTGDMTELPYPDARFDVVTASLAIHNIPSREGRRRAVEEAVRVLAPGGTIVIADIQRTDEYVENLRAAGLHVSRRPLGWRGWWSGPWMSTTAVVAVSPGAARE
ncbi:class I SAM-dependent methyltransferase [Humibacter ginsenosidimutans]|uniref:Class I SAM-dependent methyltransferase n=1 Tax=Humibacter ginsenosidimutans TaxID=2599293 RepID=A0A5B8M318_9MICO|nr:class I SAM-dependent methyltransferase [Humibacter ginsenosidimutans]QDZ14344.1 class I SAM-dependent methyltransferase [Humibacter ginsenosidimutans]